MDIELTGRKTRFARLATLVGALVLMATVIASATPFAYGKSTFCAPGKPVRDFGFSKLPPVREVPESAKGLGYGAVTMNGGWSRVMSEPVPFGYGFSEHTYTEEGALLNWTVTAQLWIVNNRGKAIREVDQDKLFIGRLRSANQPHIDVDPLEKRRGFYRFDLQIANKAGKVLGSYGAYFKVVPPSWRPRLELSRDVLWPGETLLIRVENHGSEIVSFGESFWVSRFEEGRWRTARDLTPRLWKKWLGFLGPGGTGGCSSLSLPATTPPGQYRISKGVGTELWPEGEFVGLVGSFEVVGSAGEIEYELRGEVVG